MIGRVSILIPFLIILSISAACKPESAAIPTGTPTPHQTVTALPTQPLATPTTTPTDLQPEPVDLIFHNGEVLTMDESAPRAQALAVRGDRIAAVGNEAQVMALKGPDTQVVDLQGQTLMPGFVDPHTHLLNDAWRMDLDLAGAQQLALANGITTLGNLFTTPDFLAEMEGVAAAGDLRVRTSLYLIATDNCGESQEGWWKDHPPTRNTGEMLRIGGVKIFADGGSCGEPAVSEPFFPDYGLGDLWSSDEELEAMIREADAVGFQVVVHAIGDRAIRQALNAYEAVLGGGGNPLRHRIDHNSVLTDDLLPRYGQLGVLPVVFGYYRVCEVAPFTDFYQRSAWRWPELIAANPNLQVAWHGDEPWVGTGNPFLDVLSMATRYSQADDGTLCAPPDWLGSKTVPIQTVLEMMTIHAAYALDRDEEVGSLQTGKFADLIVLSDDPTAVDPVAVGDIQVWMTMVDGIVEHCQSSREAFCPEPHLDAGSDSDIVQGPSRNLAMGQSVHASQALPNEPPENAVDGAEGQWGSGAYAPQWIDVDLGGPNLVEAIRLTVAQYPEGETTHIIEVAGLGESLRLVATLEGETREGQVLEYKPESPLERIARIRITTTVSPSWIAWREIEVMGVPME